MNRPIIGFRRCDWDIELGENWGRFPFSPKFKKFRKEIKWNGPFRFGQTGIFGTTYRSDHNTLSLLIRQTVVPSTTLLCLVHDYNMADVCESLYECSICEYRTADTHAGTHAQKSQIQKCIMFWWMSPPFLTWFLFYFNFCCACLYLALIKRAVAWVRSVQREWTVP